MFAMLRFVFYTFVAVVVGVFIGTVPVQGRTIADRIQSAFKTAPGELERWQKTARDGLDKAESTVTSKVETGKKKTERELEKAKVVVASAAAPITAGAANSPERHTREDQDALERIIATRSKK